MDTPVFSHWRKSSRSGSAGDNCVEVSQAADGTVGIRDSKHPDGDVLTVSPVAWRHFTHHLGRHGKR